jgi:hypothetical protein
VQAKRSKSGLLEKWGRLEREWPGRSLSGLFLDSVKTPVYLATVSV